MWPYSCFFFIDSTDLMPGTRESLGHFLFELLAELRCRSARVNNTSQGCGAPCAPLPRGQDSGARPPFRRSGDGALYFL